MKKIVICLMLLFCMSILSACAHPRGCDGPANPNRSAPPPAYNYGHGYQGNGHHHGW